MLIILSIVLVGALGGLAFLLWQENKALDSQLKEVKQQREDARGSLITVTASNAALKDQVKQLQARLDDLNKQTTGTHQTIFKLEEQNRNLRATLEAQLAECEKAYRRVFDAESKLKQRLTKKKKPAKVKKRKA